MASCPTSLRLQTGRDGIAQALGILGRPILIVDFDESDFGELLEIQCDQIRDVEIASIGCTGSCEKDVRDAVADVQAAVTGKPIIERDPAEGETFGRAGSFEIFVERGLGQHVGARPAVASHDEGRQIIFIAELVDEVNVDQPVLRCCGRNPGAGRCGRTRDRRRARGRACRCGGPRSCGGTGEGRRARDRRCTSCRGRTRDRWGARGCARP